MSTLKGVLLSLPVVAVALAALAVGLVELGRYWALGVVSLAFLAVPLVLAVVYIRWYHRLPYVPLGTSTTSGPAVVPGTAPDEGFEDPVEEADRLAQASKSAPPLEAPAIVEDDSAPEPPPAR